MGPKTANFDDFTAHQLSSGKVMFLYVSVCQSVSLSTGEGPHVTITHDALALILHASFHKHFHCIACNKLGNFWRITEGNMKRLTLKLTHAYFGPAELTQEMFSV